jgi:hypothetical protein
MIFGLDQVQSLKYVIFFLYLTLGTVVNEVIVEWTSLEPGRTYKIDEMKTFFGESEEQVNQSSHLHR